MELNGHRVVSLFLKDSITIFSLQIKQASSILEVHAAIASAASNLALLGSLTVIRTMTDRDEVVESALKFYLDKRQHVPLQQ